MKAARASRARATFALGRLVGSRLRHSPLPALLVCVGVAAAAALLGGIGVASVVTRDAGLERSLERLAPRDRAVRASISRSERQPGEYRARLEPAALGALAAFGPRVALERGLLAEGVRARDGTIVQVVALDRPARWARLASGRLPHRCDGRRCEGVVVAGPQPKGGVLDVNGLRVMIVGRARLSDVPLGQLVAEVPEGTLGGSQEGRYERAAGGTLVLLAGVAPVAEASALTALFRLYFWTRELEPGSVHPWNAGTLTRQITRARGQLAAADPDSALAAPDAAIRAEQRRGRAAARRLLLLGGQAGVALLAFAAYAASRRRRSVAEELDRLRHAGARRSQLATFVLLEAALLTGAGALVGWLLAVVGAAIAAAARGVPGDRLLGASALSGEGVALAGAVWLVAALTVAAYLRAGSPRGRLRGRALDAAAAAALVALVWEASARGGLGAGELGSGGAIDPVLLLLPGLVTFVAAVAAVRLLPAVFRLMERLARRSPVPVRLAVLSAAREPARTAMAVTFLAISLATGVFALSYRESLLRGQREQAAFRAVSDMRIVEPGPTLTAPPTVLPLDRYERLAGAHATPVLRASAHPAGAAGVGSTVELLGVPAPDLASLRGWRTDFADAAPADLSRRLGPPEGLTLAGDELRPGTRALRLSVRITGSPLSLDVALQRRDGTFERLQLGRNVGPGRLTLSHRLSGRLAAARVVAIVLSAPPGEERHLLSGSTRLGPLLGATGRGGDTTVTEYGPGWEAAPGSRLERLRDGARVEYALAGSLQVTGLRHRQPAGREPVPAILSEALARDAGDGEVLLQLQTGPAVSLKAVATARLFPGTEDASDRFAIADAGRLFAALNTKSPGSLVANEVWLRLTRPAARSEVLHALGTAPFRLPRVRVRADLEHALAADPLATGVVWMLLLAACLGLVLGVTGLSLTVAAELADETGELRQLEALGLRPAAVRREVRLRAFLVAALALLSGLLGGLALGRLITGLVDLAANATTPLPPLVSVAPLGQIALLLAAAAALVAALIMLQTRRAFRADSAGRLHG